MHGFIPENMRRLVVHDIVANMDFVGLQTVDLEAGKQIGEIFDLHSSIFGFS